MENSLPFPVIQTSSNRSQERCIQQNQLPPDGKVNKDSTYGLQLPPFLQQQQCHYQQPYRSSQYQHEIPQPFQPQHYCAFHSYHGLPFSFLLNGSLENPRRGSLGVSDAMLFPSCPDTLVMQEKGKGQVHDLPQQVIGLLEETTPYWIFHEKEFSDLDRIVGQQQEPPAEPNSAYPAFKEVTSDEQADENAVAERFEGTSEQQPQIEQNGVSGNLGIDLNTTLQQKARRKKHRPKVIIEGKPSRTVKPKTPNSGMPNTPNNTETPTVKRKYVRRKNVTPHDNSSFATATVEVPVSEGKTAGIRVRGKSARRCINFDADDGMPTDNIPTSQYSSAYSAEVANYQNQWRDVARTRTNPNTTDIQQREMQTTGQASVSRISFDLNHSASSVASEHVSFAKEPVRTQRLANTTRTDQVPNISQSLRTPPQQPSRKVLIKENLKAVEREETRGESSLNGVLSDVPSQPLTATANTTITDQIPNISQGLRTPPQQPSRRVLIRDNLKASGREESRGDSILNGSLSDVLAMGVQRNQRLFEDSPSSTYTNLIISEINKVNGCNKYLRIDQYPTEHPKKRWADEHIEVRTSPTCSGISTEVTQTTPRSWLAYGTPSNSSKGFPLADAQSIGAEQRTKGSKNILGQTLRSEWNVLYCSGSPYGANTRNCNLESTPEQPLGSEGRKRSEIDGATSCDGSVILNSKETYVANLHTIVGQKQLYNSLSLDAETQHCQQGDFLRNHFASLGYKSLQMPASKRPKTSRNPDSQVNYIQYHQNGCNFHRKSGSGEVAEDVTMYSDLVEDISIKLQQLDINKENKGDPFQTQNALVVYNGVKAMVQYETSSNLTKKRRPRVKVHLDEETNREWNFLMGKETVDEDNRVGKDKEKYWEDEREVFRGRSDSFIARMHLVQGDRRFSPWKGSVVDSVVGVFLTQNVSDHLSSSAFMALAAKFPLRRSNDEYNAEKTTAPTSEDNKHILDSDDGIRCKEKASTQDSSDGGSTLTDETQNIVSREYTESISVLCCQNSIDERGSPSKGDESPESRNHAALDIRLEKVSTVMEHRLSMEDAILSQNSVVSSHNSSEYTLQASFEATKTPRNETETTIESMLHSTDSSNTFTELLELATGRTLANYSGPSDQWQCEDSEDRTSAFFNLVNPKSSLPSLSMVSSLSTQDLMGQPLLPIPTYHLHDALNSRVLQTQNTEVREIRNSDSSSSVISQRGNTISTNQDSIAAIDQEKYSTSENVLVLDTDAPVNKYHVNQIYLTSEGFAEKSNLFDENPSIASDKPKTASILHIALPTNDEHKANFQPNKRADVPVANGQYVTEVSQLSINEIHQVTSESQKDQVETSEVSQSTVKRKPIQEKLEIPDGIAKQETKVKRRTTTIKRNTVDWDNLRKDACGNFNRKERNSNTMDSVDWEAVRQADMKEISETIRERGMNNMLAERIKEFLNRLVKDHGSIDLEWLRDVPPDKAKEYLLSIRGLGLKSVECVRLLTLHHKAFPVDTNVGRICVRLGWVPLQPLPESLQLHLLELYPVLETIQKYLWPRLCTLDQRTLYELHYQMITFGKVFCTKSKPNCNSCPMRGECKHFASAFASARLALPGPEEKSLCSSTFFTPLERGASQVPKPVLLPQIEGGSTAEEKSISNICEPIIEEPVTPEPEFLETSQSAIDEAFYEDPDEIPTIKLNFEAFTQNIQNYMQSNSSTEGENELLSRALVLLSPEAASIPVPKLKNVSRLRTEHQVYELPDTHPLLKGLDKRETDDPSSYLLAIWTPGETAQSIEPPKIYCTSQETGRLCNEMTCFSCSSKREADTQIVRGTLLIPCRTATRGSFPLNGTYFQVNEVFADHETSYSPMNVPRAWIWNLPRRTVYFGTSVPTIFKGLSTEGIQHCFWRGFVCVRGFDRTRRAPRPLYARLHFPASKVTRSKKTAAYQDG